MIRKKELYRYERFWTLIIAFLVFLTCLWLTYTERFIKEEYSYVVKCIFVNSETNAPYFLMPHIFVTTENIGRGIAGDASWGKTSLQE